MRRVNTTPLDLTCTRCGYSDGELVVMACDDGSCPQCGARHWVLAEAGDRWALWAIVVLLVAIVVFGALAEMGRVW